MESKSNKCPEISTNTKDNQLRIFNSLLNNLQGVVYSKLYDQQLTLLYISDGVMALTGYSPDALIYNKQLSFQSLKHPEDRDRVKAVIDEAIAQHAHFKINYRIIHADGSVIWVREHGHAVYDADDEPLSLEGYFEDITALVDAEMAVSKAHNRYRAIFDNALHGIFQTTLRGEYQIVNQTLAEIYGYGSPEELITALNDINKQLYVSPTRREEFVQAMNVEGVVRDFESQVFKKGGEIVWISESARKVYDESGVFLYYEGTVVDITELKHAKQALIYSEINEKKANEELFYIKYALDRHAIVSIADLDGNITYVNDQFCTRSGYAKHEVLGQHYQLLNSGKHSKAFFDEMQATIANGQTWMGEVCNKSKSGKLYWLYETIVPYLDKNGKPIKYINIHTDITNRKLAEQKSKFLALYDPLTRLPNKNLVNDRLRHALAISKRSGNLCALLVLDVDHFKKLNDSLGHAIGDLLLKQVSARIAATLRESDTVARVGGDEFAILAENLSSDKGEAVAQAEVISNKLIDVINRPYTLTDHEFHTSASIGIVTFGGRDQAQSQETIMHSAEVAMYEAKSNGRNAVCWFQPQMLDQIVEKVALERELRNALNKHQLTLYYQLQVNAHGKGTGAEALLRWNHPTRGFISPLAFIPLAEETGLILPIGQWVLETACAQLKAWEASASFRPLTLSINVSAKQFYQKGFVSQVASCIERFGINPRKLKLELTESMLLDNVELTISKMNALLKLGISFSLDDFGTGYSSLQYLKRLPIFQLKIDRSFVSDIMVDKNDLAIVRTIIAMANTLNLIVIAEGIETKEQQQILFECGCMDYQGFYFGKPLPINAFEAALN